MGQEKGENSAMSYFNSISLVGFVGSDPEQRQTWNNGSKFTVLSVTTQRSWKGADEQWHSKAGWHRAWKGLGEYAATKLRKGDYIYVEPRILADLFVVLVARKIHAQDCVAVVGTHCISQERFLTVVEC
jgi:hypothetical protein